ncbi:MAG TPA: hypothetical protein VGR22_05810 [Thermomicrobiales bacterium]|nr:hypothetical protein [Thermomicrobiales bacterium]
MPKILGALGTVRGFMNVVKEVDFDEVRSRAETAPRVLVVADEQGRAERFVTEVFGDDAMRHVDIRTGWFEDIDASRWDVIVVLDPTDSGVLPKVKSAVGEAAKRKLVDAKVCGPGMTVEEITAAQDAIVSADTEFAAALGRRFPELQLAAVKAIVDETAKANAQFALVSNAPAIVPFIGGIVAASADLIVLTKNQVMMVYKIAAVHNRALDNQLKLMRELAPVVGSGFLWRTLAREAASFLPLAAGTVPKVAIAYVGTVVMGRAADYYYRFGKKPTREHLREFTRRASETASRLQISRKDEQEARKAEPAETAERQQPTAEVS